MYGEMLKNLHKKSPLIHCITNYVTAGDCANILLACGASPIMADDPREAAEITEMCDGLVINIGTLSERVVPSMLSSGRQAERLSIRSEQARPNSEEKQPLNCLVSFTFL